MSDTERSKEWVLERVKKLLTLGNNDGATEGERENAMRMAHKLLAKYNLDIAEAEAHGTATAEPREIHEHRFYGRPWARQVCKATADLFFCEYIYMPHEDANLTAHYFIGRHSNAVTAANMAVWLVRSIRSEARRKLSALGNTMVRSFCIGAALAITERVAKIIADKNPAEPGMSLVLASHYATEQAANQTLKSETFNIVPGRSQKSRVAVEAAILGKEYGSKVSLDRQVEGAVDRPRIK